MNKKIAFTNSPKKGDLIVIDDERKLRCVKSSFALSNVIPSGWEKVATVSVVRGNEVEIDALEEQTLKMLEGYEWKVTGMTLDGADHNIVIQHYLGGTTATEVGTFTYNATTAEDFAAQFDAWLRAHEIGMLWHCAYDTDLLGNPAVILMADKFTSYYHSYSPIKSGATATNTMDDVWPTSSSTPAVGYQNGTQKGFNHSYPWPNYLSAKAYGLPQSATAAAETGDTTSFPVHPDVFAKSTKLVANFVTYDNYLRGTAPLLDVTRGAAGTGRLYGADWQKAVAERTFVALDGTRKYRFPAFRYVANFEKAHAALARGKWKVADVNHMAQLMREITYSSNATWRSKVPELVGNRAEADITNRVRYAAGGTVVNVSASRWCSVRSSAGYGWGWYGYYGALSYHGNLCSACVVCPSALLNLNELNT